MKTDTIAAIATPRGHGGIGIIRISGPKALAIAQTLFRAKHNDIRIGNMASSINAAQSHRLIYGTIIDPHTQNILDEIMAVYMPAPRSYTCEDVVEFQTHGGPVILDTVFRLICLQGARPAQPGEFTQRAFLNGRIDLTQAEAVADMIAASNEHATNMAAQHLSGKLKTTLRMLIEALTELLADVEAAIEFPDDIGEPYDRSYLLTHLTQRLLQPVDQLLQTFTIGRIVREGLRLAIVGRPNVGKSSLLNALIESNRAIVTELPGTTRDTIEAPATVDGFPIIFIDTAGLHQSKDPVESIGMQKTEETIQTADLVLLVVESNHLDHPQDLSIFRQIGQKPVHLVINKIDLVIDPDQLQVRPQFSALTVSSISALHGTGLAQLKTTIRQLCLDQPAPTDESVIITNARHYATLQQILECLQNAQLGLSQGVPEDIVAIDLHQALAFLQRLVGDSFDQDLLDTIFKRFCIGK